jgi:hypothetical protein
VREEFEYDKMHEKLSEKIAPSPSKEEVEWLKNLGKIEIL